MTNKKFDDFIQKIQKNPKILDSLPPEELADLNSLLETYNSKTSLTSFAQDVSGGRWKPYKWLDYVAEHLEALENREILRLAIMAPPRHGKSELSSVYFPAWYLTRNPNHRIILSSYEEDFARNFGRRVRSVIDENSSKLGLSVSKQSSSASRWDLANYRGGMVTAGAGGPITGKGANLFIIDDPIKNAEDAYSEKIRNSNWDWWTSTAFTRLEPDSENPQIRGVVLFIATRWHEDDLLGRILDHEGDQWTVIKLPAIAEEDDQLGRVPGSALCPERFPLTELEKIRATVSDQWSSLYQQSPVPASGGRFKRETFRYWSPRPAEEKVYQLHDPDGILLVPQSDTWRFCTVDFALTAKESSDWTVLSIWDVAGYLEPSRLILVDRARIKVESTGHLNLLHRFFDQYKPVFIGVEKQALSISVIQAAIRDGLPIKSFPIERDKWGRSELAATLAENGRVYFPRKAPWLSEWEHELLTFPAGKYDDQVDVFSLAAYEMIRNVSYLRKQRSGPPITAEDRFAKKIANLGKKKPFNHPTLGKL